jgi:histidinol-phosphate aminotransferase
MTILQENIFSFPMHEKRVTMPRYIRPSIAAMKGYVPGFQPDPKENYIKLNSNENPYPASPRVKEALQKMNYEDLRIYPDPESLALRKKIGSLYGFTPDQIICGNGSDDILNIIVRAFAEPGEAIGFHEPTFPLYRVLAAIHGTKAVPLPLTEPYTNPSIPPDTVKVFFLANPNSPVGFGYSRALVTEMAKKTKGIFVVDEAYAEFAGGNCLDLIREMENVIVVRTVSKSYSLAGVRLGYAIAHEKWVKEMLKVKDPFNVTSLTQALAAAAMEDQAYFREITQKIAKTREWFFQEATALGYRILPSQANFIFPQPPQKGRGKAFHQALFERRILTRYYDEEGLRDGIRLTIGTPEEMEKVLKVFREILPEFKRT